MECKQVRDQWGCYALLQNRTCSREETMETIVPDACPDIARILDTSGVCRLNRRELTEQGVLLSGTIQTVTLYVPEGGQGVWRLESTLAFQHLHECQKPERTWRLLAKVWVSAAETRTVNPRKVLVRVDLTEQVRLYAQQTLSVCTALEQEPSLQQRLDRCQTTVTVDTAEKLFTLQDELPLSLGRRGGCTLLRVLPGIQCSEARRVGSKLVLKGALTAALLLRSEDGQLFPAEAELPFSQMLDAPEGEGEYHAKVEVQLADFSYGALSTDGRSLSVTAQVLADAVYSQSITFSALTDLFSTRYPVDCRQEELVLYQHGPQSQRLTIREQVDTSDRVQAVCSCQTMLGAVQTSQEGDQLRLSVNGVTSVVYQREDGGVASLRHPFQTETLVQQSPGDVCLWSCDLGQMEALLSASGLELRGNVELAMDIIHPHSLRVVTWAEMDTDTPEGRDTQPSVVLCRPKAGDRVWDIAKRYRSTCQQICAANGLTEDQSCGSEMLLVPRQR